MAKKFEKISSGRRVTGKSLTNQAGDPLREMSNA